MHGHTPVKVLGPKIELKVLSTSVFQNHFRTLQLNYAVGKAEDITHCRRWLHVLVLCYPLYKSQFPKTNETKAQNPPFFSALAKVRKQ